MRVREIRVNQIRVNQGLGVFHMKLWLLTAISKKELTSVGSSNEVLQIIVLYCNYNLNMILQVLQWNLTWNVILI